MKYYPLGLPKTGNPVLLLDFLKYKRGHGYQNQVIKAEEKENLGKPERSAGDNFAFTGQFNTRDDVCQRRIFNQVYDLVAAAGQGPSNCLGHDDVAHGSKCGKTHGLGSQDLSFFDG
jgi:hypothetical protein